MDLYCQMGEELRSLFADLFDPRHSRIVRQKMARIQAVATQIGGSIRKEAEQLNSDVIRYLDHPNDPKLVAVMKEHALKLERETREI